MRSSFFWTCLAVVSLLTVIILYFLQTFEVLQAHFKLSLLFWSVMILTTIGLYYLGVSAIKSDNKYAFIRLVISSIMFKIVLVLVIMALYMKIASPENRYFVVPVLIIYLLFSILETYVLYKLANEKPHLDHE